MSEQPVIHTVVFGRRPDRSTVEVLGIGVPHDLDSRLIEPDAAVSALLRAGAVPTDVGAAWVDTLPGTDLVAVRAWGHRESPLESPAREQDQQHWLIELSRPTNAPRPLPTTVGDRNALCFLFRWLSWCRQR